MSEDIESTCALCGKQTSGYSVFGDNGKRRCKDCVLEAVRNHFNPETHYIEVKLNRKQE